MEKVKQLTAVQWLIEQLSDEFSNYPDAIVEQAKAIEKEQIINALQEFSDITLPDEVCEKYYNETFKSE